VDVLVDVLVRVEVGVPVDVLVLVGAVVEVEVRVGVAVELDGGRNRAVQALSRVFPPESSNST
jgi:hypothetical protein